ncbi:hypothetical protein QQ045_002259 [Rhodiola kirilowii]
MHDMRLIHTDLKPENILLVSSDYVKVPDYKASSRSPKDYSYRKRVPKSSAIKVIDFGITTYDKQGQSYIVSSRHYRAPETGEALFQTHENLEHLAKMERVLGALAPPMLKRADRHAEKYVRKGWLDWTVGGSSRVSVRSVSKLRRLPNLRMQNVEHSVGDLIHLLQGLLKYDPSDRLTA